jgi:hypothetical protein
VHALHVVHDFLLPSPTATGHRDPAHQTDMPRSRAWLTHDWCTRSNAASSAARSAGPTSGADRSTRLVVDHCGPLVPEAVAAAGGSAAPRQAVRRPALMSFSSSARSGSPGRVGAAGETTTTSGPGQVANW